MLSRFVLGELVETERTYVDDLGQIVEVVLASPPEPWPTDPFPLPGDIFQIGRSLWSLYRFPLLLDFVQGRPEAELT